MELAGVRGGFESRWRRRRSGLSSRGDELEAGWARRASLDAEANFDLEARVRRRRILRMRKLRDVE